MCTKTDENTQEILSLHKLLTSFHEAQGQQLEQCKVSFNRQLGDFRNEHTTKIDDLKSQFATQGQQLEQCKASFNRHFSDFRNEHATKIDDLASQFATHTRMIEELHSKLDAQAALHSDLATSHMKLFSTHEESHKLFAANCSQLALQFEEEREARVVEKTAMEEKQGAELGTLRKNLQSLWNAHGVQRERYEKGWEEIDVRVQEQQNRWDSRIGILEPRVDNAMFELKSIHGEMKNGMDRPAKKIKDTESSLDECFRASLHKANHERLSDLQGDAKQRKDSIDKIYEQCSQCSQEISKMDGKWGILSKLITECKSAQNELERSVSECRKIAATSVQEQRVNDLAAMMVVDREKLQHELQEVMQDLRKDFIEDRNHLSKMIDEEKTASKKMIEDLLHSLHDEHEDRSRQNAEIRADFVKAITKEREDRIVDGAGQHVEVSKALREWQHLKSAGGLVASGTGSLFSGFVSPSQ